MPVVPLYLIINPLKYYIWLLQSRDGIITYAQFALS